MKDNAVKRNEIRDHILAIMKKANQGKQKFLTVLDVNNATTSLNDFHQFILSALLQCKTNDHSLCLLISFFCLAQRRSTRNRVNLQIKRNLLLTLDWNLPYLAQSEIFQRDDDIKYSIQPDLFDRAILEEKLEPFVDLFLDQQFTLHRYLTSDKLVSLFNRTENPEFLITTSLEGILGLTGVRISLTGPIKKISLIRMR